MARDRIIRTVFEKIDPHRAQREAKEARAKRKQLENQQRQIEEAEKRRMEKEQKRLEEKRSLVQQKIREAVERGEITEAEAAMVPELDEDFLVGWAHMPYIDKMTSLRQQMEDGEWLEVCHYLGDKKDYNPVFAQTVRLYFSSAYTFEEYPPHGSPYRRWYKKGQEKSREEIEKEFSEPWADNLYDACAPHLVVTYKSGEDTYQFGIMTIWRQRFTKHGLSMMARSQFIKAKLFEQETDIPVFMIFGIGGTAEQPERMFCLPFNEIENHFIPKPIALRNEWDVNQQFHYIPEFRRLR